MLYILRPYLGPQFRFTLLNPLTLSILATHRVGLRQQDSERRCDCSGQRQVEKKRPPALTVAFLVLCRKPFDPPLIYFPSYQLSLRTMPEVLVPIQSDNPNELLRHKYIYTLGSRV